MEESTKESILKDKKIAVLTLGCKVNQYETDGMREELERVGCKFVNLAEEADIYLVNTCSVTNMAERKSRQMLHRAKKQNPKAVVAAIGCYVQAAPEEVREDSAVDILIGNNCKKNIAGILEKHLENQINQSSARELNTKIPRNEKTEKKEHMFQKNDRMVRKECVHENVIGNEYCQNENHENQTNELAQNWIPIGETKEYEELFLTHMQEHTRAYIKIQDGCDQFCAYCIIPYVRGRIRSRRQEDILEEVRRLAEEGCKEVVLTGIHLSSYGKDWNNGTALLEIIRQLNDVKGILRIRLGSLEPRIITEEFVRGLKEIPKLCPHFHLSLQSACNETLRRMNRKYTIEEYQESCSLLRRTFDRPAITTDVIVGFPGETEAEFETTCRNLEALGLYEIHVFKYSRRRGTVAERLPEQVSEQEKTRRSEILLAMTARQKQAFEDCFRGEQVQVLIEEKVEKNGKDWYVGHTERYRRVEVQAEQDVRNQMVSVDI
ncbi:MAG: tRNA (N(6)-L-threonylcarbamoyladenosine(37)-C(2))-methylthiotransferase MtaB [Bacteroides sp.]|nr:tRNA (N(6)-L-threonylcarbamoyladenosine(37)-C(2))-methylthiotransferase MtaB [Bacteroides sp.]MCM1548624.1 tRNA (N(6)-L-threonylcarbamoyladenosine(37)-C(2))-methylthiotransferase MtaB [Clostridium sp.]